MGKKNKRAGKKGAYYTHPPYNTDISSMCLQEHLILGSILYNEKARQKALDNCDPRCFILTNDKAKKELHYVLIKRVEESADKIKEKDPKLYEEALKILSDVDQITTLPI